MASNDSSAGAGARPSPFTPVVTALAVANLAVYALEVYLARRASLDTPSGVLLRLGANHSTLTLREGHLETLVTSCFLHGSALHLGFNLLALAQAGPLVERSVGPARFTVAYLVAGIVGSLTSALVGWGTTTSVSVGASGAICGLLGAALVLGWRLEGPRGPLTRAMGRWLGTVIAFGVFATLTRTARIDNAAHVGGAVGGMLVAATFKRGVRYSDARTRATVALGALVVIASFATVVVRGRRDPLAYADAGGRLRAAVNALRAGRCEPALTAAARARALDPANALVADHERTIQQACRAGGAPAPGLPPFGDFGGSLPDDDGDPAPDDGE